MNWIDTNTLIAICACAIGLTQFLFWRYIAKNKTYESEKGKNLATKEDIAGITKEIESIKESYNKALETHKVELQKEFEKSKHTIALCQRLDEKLIEILLECHILLGESASFGGTEFLAKKDIEECLYPLFIFLNKYSSRYSSNEVASRIIKLSERFELITIHHLEMEAQAEAEDNNNFNFEKEYHRISADVLFASSCLLSVLLPSLNNGKAGVTIPHL